MKVLQINCVYRKGSTGKIVYNIHEELMQQNIESIVCYGRGKKVAENNVYKVCSEIYAKLNNLRSRMTGIMYGGCSVATRKLISIITKEKPDIVHLHCINGFFVNIYQLVEWLKNNNIKTVLTLHAEFMYTGGCSYALECEKWRAGCLECPRLKRETKSWFFDRTYTMWKRMKKAFEGFEENLTVVSVSPWLMQRVKQSKILGNKRHSVILNGLDIDKFRLYNTNELRKKHGIRNKKILFHVTPYFCNEPNHIKGGYYILQLAELMKNENIVIVVAGKYDSTLTVPSHMIMLGEISEQQELAKYYSMADVTILTSKRETFSMVAAESLCCGTPVVGFKAGAPEQITISEYSDFVEYGNLEKLKSAIDKWLNVGVLKEDVCAIATRKYTKEKMVTEYLELYSKVEREKCDEF